MLKIKISKVSFKLKFSAISCPLNQASTVLMYYLTAMANDEKEDKDGNKIDDEFAPNLFGAFVRTMVWFVGEVENEDMWVSDKDGNVIHTKIEDWMAKFILLVFIFLFVIVVMNLMNAVAIVDIQVNNF